MPTTSLDAARPVPVQAAVNAIASPLEMGVIDGLRRGRPGLLEKLIKAYLAYAPSAVEGLRTAARQGNIEAVRMAAHSLKSSSASMGAVHLSSIFKVLEHQATAGNTAAIGPLVEEVAVEFERVVAALVPMQPVVMEPVVMEPDAAKRA